jgi:hypothetical protein
MAMASTLRHRPPRRTLAGKTQSFRNCFLINSLNTVREFNTTTEDSQLAPTNPKKKKTNNEWIVTQFSSSAAARDGRTAHTTNKEWGAVSEERRKVAIAGAPAFHATNTLTMVHLTPVPI